VELPLSNSPSIPFDLKIPEEKNSRSTRCMTPKRIREPVDMEELAAKYFGSENGV